MRGTSIQMPRTNSFLVLFTITWQVFVVAAVFSWGVLSPKFFESLSISIEFLKSRSEPTPVVRELHEIGITWATTLPYVIGDLAITAMFVLLNIGGSCFAFSLLAKRYREYNRTQITFLLVAIASGVFAPLFLLYQAT